MRVEDYTERECVMIGRCDVLSGGPFQRKIPNGLGIIKPPGPDATNAMGALRLSLSPRGARRAHLLPARRAPPCPLRFSVAMTGQGRVGRKNGRDRERDSRRSSGDLRDVIRDRPLISDHLLPAHPKQEVVRPGL